METTEREIEELAKAAGADLVGFTDRARLADAPASGDMTYVLPSAESAIGLAVSMDLKAAEKYISKEDLWEFNESHTESYRALKRAGIAIQEYLEARGHEVALPFANFEWRPGTPNNVQTPPLSHKYVCVASGVGWIGWSGNLLTSEYGALVTLGSVVTSAKLTPSPLVEEDWCGNCRLCVTSCPTHYMPKKESDVVQIGGKPSTYSHRRDTLRCTVTCGGENNLRTPTSKWSTWSPKTLTELPNAKKSDEDFRNRCQTIADENPDNATLQYLMDVQNTTHNWDDYDRVVEGMVLNCSYCQLVCMPGLDKRKEMYRSLISSGRIEEGDPRLVDPNGSADHDGTAALLPRSDAEDND